MTIAWLRGAIFHLLFLLAESEVNSLGHRSVTELKKPLSQPSRFPKQGPKLKIFGAKLELKI